LERERNVPSKLSLEVLMKHRPVELKRERERERGGERERECGQA
jgi:hypothetical protein